MQKVKFKKGDQRIFFIQIKEKSGLNWAKFAKIYKINKRTLFDWRREKYHIPKNIYLKLSARYNCKTKITKFLPEFWGREISARLGGLATFKKYGIPGTLESRRIGGLKSQLRRQLYPEKYSNCINQIKIPKKSKYLAEFCGIILGDGGLTQYQSCITLPKDHITYIKYINELIYKLFKIKAKNYFYNNWNRSKICNIKISSTLLIKFLDTLGLKKGNKVKNQSAVPDWINVNKNFSKYCMVGLMDTDGCIYKHEHISGGKKMFNIGICFSSHSKPLLNFVYNTLQSFSFNPKYNGHGVYLYREKEVIKYYKEIGTSNPYNLRNL